MATTLTIGQLAQRADVGVVTVRYYQRRGITGRTGKTTWRSSTLSGADGEKAALHQAGAGHGFTLSEIRNLFQLNQSGVCSETRALA